MKSKMIKRAIIGGAITTLVLLLGLFAVGRIGGGGEALLLLEAMLPTVRFLCSASITAAATILALMLTLLSISSQADPKMSEQHYRRVKRISMLASVLLASGTFLLLFLSLPLKQSDNIPPSFFEGIYYSVLGVASMLGGMLISVVVMLYTTIAQLVRALGFGDASSPLLAGEPDDEKDDAEVGAADDEVAGDGQLVEA